jgi:uncharacterized ubiquitin-like protein YukD
MNDTKDNTDFFDFLKEDYDVLPDDRHPAISEIEKHLPTISKLSLMAKNLTVDDSSACGVALDITADIRNLDKAIEDLRKKAGEPARRLIQMINDSAKGLQEILSRAEHDVKVKIATYHMKEEEKMKVAEESVKELSAKLGVDIVIPSDARNVHSAKATTYFKEELSFEIVDVDLIPDEYWVVDEKLLQKHIDLGKKEIPGVKIVKGKKFVVRRK